MLDGTDTSIQAQSFCRCRAFFTPSNLLVPPVRSAEIEKAVIASIISASAVHYGSCVTAGVCVFLIK